jgi:phage-related protein
MWGLLLFSGTTILKFQTLNETLTVSDALVKNVEKCLTENVTYIDDVDPHFTKILTETITLTETDFTAERRVPVHEFRFGTYSFGQAVEAWKQKDNIELDATEVARRAGALIRAGKFKAKQIIIQGSIRANNKDDLITARNSLRASILNKTENLFMYQDRYIECRVSKYADDFQIGSGLTALNFSITFQSTTPFYQYDLERDEVVTITTGGSTIFEYFDNGNVETPLKVSVTAPAGGISNNLSFENLTMQRSFTFSGNIAGNDRLEVDARVVPNTVINGVSNGIANFSGEFPRMTPGANLFSVATEVGAQIRLQWRARFI